MSGSSAIGPAFLGVGVLSALLATVFYLRTRRFLTDSVSTQGTVMGLVESHSSEGGSTFRPVVQFTTHEGQAIQFTESVGRSPPKYQPGNLVTVRYIPTNPQRARIPSWFGSWYLPVFFLGFALVFGGVGAWQYLSGSEQVEAAQPATSASGVVATVVPGAPAIPTPGGSVLTVQEGAGPPRAMPATCDSIRDRGKGRTVELSFDGGAISFTAQPFTGAGPYQPGVNLKVGGSVFSKGDAGSLAGAVVFDDSGRVGAINLTAGSRLVAGAWDCTDLPKP